VLGDLADVVLDRVDSEYLMARARQIRRDRATDGTRTPNHHWFRHSDQPRFDAPPTLSYAVASGTTVKLIRE
jgi:hypothetical protein